MALQAAYKQFLAVPTSAALTADASLHYITTTTSFIGATDIIKHLGTAQHQVKKKQENILYAIEGPNAVALEAETTLEFVVSGGPYLPGLDDNFVADRTVILPIVSHRTLGTLQAATSNVYYAFPTNSALYRSTSLLSTRRARSSRSAKAGTKDRF